VRPSLLEIMDRGDLKTAAEELDADELADLIPELPTDLAREVLTALGQREQTRVREAMSSAEGTVGALMDFDLVTVREDVTLGVVTRYLRRFDALPDHTDKLFVIDRDQRLRGNLTLEALLINEPETRVGAVMQTSGLILFRAEDEACEAAHAFERYDLVSAPVVDKGRRLVARLTVSDVVDYIQAENEAEILSQAGLEEEEDIFAPILRSVRNRWSWLAINLVTAVVASRIIDLFEGSIAQLVALAALMPIVAGIGGNAGNQTITMIVRAIAMGQVQPSAWRRLIVKELGVALILL